MVTSDEVSQLFGGAFDIEMLKREDRLEAEPAWKARGCTYFNETTYLLTRHEVAGECSGNEAKK